MTKTIKIDGMNCTGCVTKLNNALNGLPETNNVNINLETQIIELDLSKDVDNDLLTNLIETAGHFEVIEIA